MGIDACSAVELFQLGVMPETGLFCAELMS